MKPIGATDDQPKAWTASTMAFDFHSTVWRGADRRRLGDTLGLRHVETSPGETGRAPV